MRKQVTIFALSFAIFSSSVFAMESDSGGTGGSSRRSAAIQGLQDQLKQEGGALTGGGPKQSGTAGHGVDVLSGFDTRAGEAYLKAEISRRLHDERKDDVFKPIEDKAREAGESGALAMMTGQLCYNPQMKHLATLISQRRDIFRGEGIEAALERLETTPPEGGFKHDMEISVESEILQKGAAIYQQGIVKGIETGKAEANSRWLTQKTGLSFFGGASVVGGLWLFKLWKDNQ